MSGDDYFIAVHGGAGYHHPEHDHRTKKALRAACTKALQNLSLKTTSSPSSSSRKSLSLVEQAIISLEDVPYLNAGYGSNLCLDGSVECDAAIIAAAGPGNTPSNGLFGSVGAVSGIKNPIFAARSILEYSQKQDKLGRVPPMTLVSQGATNFIQNNALKNTIIPPENMISPTAKETWTKWKNRLEMSEVDNVDIDEENLIQDTVGAVAWHSNDGFAAGVSSGGLLLKHPGRVGEAAIFGAGCWAKHYSDSLDGISCSISGTGEDIIRSNLACLIGETCTPDSDPHEILEKVLVDHFWRRAVEREVSKPAAGVLMMTRETSDDSCNTDVRVWCGFTTPSMAIGFASSREPQPKAYILRRPEGVHMKAGARQVYITAFRL